MALLPLRKGEAGGRSDPLGAVLQACHALKLVSQNANRTLKFVKGNLYPKSVVTPIYITFL